MNTSISKSKLLAYSIWMIASIFYAYQYILRVLPNIMIDDISAKFHIGATTFGQFSGLYYLGYSLMHIPIGMALDRFGPKKILPICILLTVIGLSPLIFSSWWVMPIIGRILIGIGSSAAILGVFKVIRMIFAEKQFTKMLSISVTIGLLGAIYGGGPVEYMRAHLGCQAVVTIIGIAGLLLAGFTFVAIPEMKEKPSKSLLSGLKEVISNKKVILSCIFAGLMVGPLEGFADVWASSYLKHSYGFTSNLASTVPSLIFVGMCFGGPILSYISSKMKSDHTTIITTALIMGAIFSTMLLVNIPPSILSPCFILIGICSAYQIIAIYKASTYVSSSAAGTATAIANMIIMSFGYAFHSSIGCIVEAMGGQTSPIALKYGIWIIPIALMIAAIGYALITIDDKKRRELTI